MKTKYYSLFIALTILIIFSTMSYAKIGTVLQVIPAGSVGWVRANSLADLNGKVDEVMPKLTPPGAPGENTPQGIILGALSQLLPIPAVNSVSKLEELGFDAHGDLSVFWMDASLQKPLIAVHVKDKAEATAALQSSGDFVDAEYQNVIYKRSDAAAFVILDDVLVYAQSEEDVRKCIETYLKTNQSLLEDPNYVSVNARWGSDANDLTGYVALDKVAEIYLPMLKMFSGMANNNMLDTTAQVGAWLLEQAESFAISVVLDAQGAKMDHFLELKDDSPIQGFLTSAPQSLELFYSLPKDVFMVGGMTMDAETTERIMMTFVDILDESNPDMPETAIAEAQNYIRSIRDFTASLGSEAAFGVQIGPGVTPNMILLYQLTHEEAARDYMEGYETRLNETMEVYRGMGLDDLVDQFSQIKPGPEETYEGVQIQSIQLTDKLPLSLPGMPSQQQSLSLWYAFQSGKLIMGFGPDPAPVKGTLDVLAGRADGMNSARSFETVHGGLPSESNFSFYFAPWAFQKWVLQMGMSVPPDVLDEVELGVMFGFSAAIQDEGIASRLYVSVDEVRQLVTAISTLSQTAQANNPYNQMQEYREQGELDKMLEYAEQRMKDYPHEAGMMQSELVRGYQEHNRLDELINHFQEKLKSDLTDVNAYKLLGQAFMFSGGSAKAVEMYEKAAVLAPDDVNVQSNLGLTYLQQGGHEKAITAYKKALQLQPGGTHIYPQLARAYERVGKTDEIAQLAESLRPHLRRQGFNYVNLGDVYLAGNLYDEAIEAYKNAIELEPRNERYIKDRLARAYEQAGKPELAAELRESIRPPEVPRPGRTEMVGKPAPEFALRNLEGKEVKLADFKDKVVILDFWATWCGPCVKEIPHFIELYKQYGEQDFAMVGISTDRGAGVVRSFVKKHQVNYPILMADGQVQSAYGGIRAIPTTFVIDKMGVIQRQYIGYRDKAVFEADIKALLAQEKASIDGITIPAHGLLKGNVTDTQTPRPNNIREATVTIESEFLLDEKPRTTKTDAAGNYEISKLPPGEYIVTVSKPGYDDSTEYATVVPDAESFLDVRLHKTGESMEIGQQVLDLEEFAAIAPERHGSSLWFRLGQSHLIIEDGKTIQACVSRLRRATQQNEESAWYLYKHLERASESEVPRSRRSRLTLIIADERLTQQNMQSASPEHWGMNPQDMTTIPIIPDSLLSEFANAMISKGFHRIPDRNRSSAIHRPVQDGEIVLVRTASGITAVIPQQQGRGDRDTSEGLKYSWFSYAGRTPDFSMEPDESGVGEDYDRYGAKISFGDITIEWSVSGNGTGRFYYPDLPGVELALTGKKALSEIDLKKDQFVFAGSLKHYLSQIGLDDWIAEMYKPEVPKKEN